MPCEHCPCPDCTAIRERRTARTLAVSQGRRAKAKDRAAVKQERREENDRFNAMIWLLVNSVDYIPPWQTVRHLHHTTRQRHIQRSISAKAIERTNQLAVELDLTTAEINLRRRAYQDRIRERINDVVVAAAQEEPWAKRLMNARAIKSELSWLTDDHAWAKFPGSIGTDLPIDRPKCPDCGENLSHRMTHLYGPCSAQKL